MEIETKFQPISRKNLKTKQMFSGVFRWQLKIHYIAVLGLICSVEKKYA